MIPRILQSHRLVIFILVLVSAFTLTIPSPNVLAAPDSADISCGGWFENEQEKIDACKDGFNNGTGQGLVCQKYKSQPNGDELDSACRTGWNTYVEAKASCQEVDPDLSEEDNIKGEEKCIESLRPNSSPPPSSNANNPSTSVNLRLGPIPQDADISNFKAPAAERSEHSVCGVSGFLGGMVCGLSTFMAKIADHSFDIIKIFLKVQPFSTLDTDGNTSATYTAWSLFRGLANIFLVIAFLITIYSHLTSIGLSNYNIKKMIPRLVVAALLINLSFYISSILVDLSNIIGTTLVDLMRGVADAAVNQDGVPLRAGNDNLSFEGVTGSVLLVGAGAAAAGAAVLYAGLPVLLPILTSGLVALVTTVLILMLRQVLIIVFIIISPLAFASILLPNTSQYFDKWKAAFTPLLMVFPAISLLYGAGYLGSITIQRTAAANGDTILQIMSLGIMVAPLFMIPAVMKLGGGLLNRFGGIANTPGSKLRKKAEERANKMSKKRDLKALNFDPNSKTNKIPGVGRIRRARANARVNRMARENLDKRISDTRDIAGTAQFRGAVENQDPTFMSRIGMSETTKGESLQKALAQSGDTREMRRAKNHILHQKIKAHASAVEAKAIEERESGVTRNDLLAKALSTDDTITALEKEAAILQLSQAGDIGAILQMVKGSYGMTQEQRQTLIGTIRKTGVGGKVPFLGNQEAQDNILRGNVNESSFGSTVVAPSLQQDDYSAATYAELDQDAVSEVAQVLGETMNNKPGAPISKEKLAEHTQSAYDAMTNPETSQRVGQGRKDLLRIADRELSHEEALMLNRLYDMQNERDDL